MARAFGTGMGMGEVCGALIGAFMVLGLSLGHQEDERQARFRTYDLVREFVERFKSHHGTIYCKELLGGVDLGTKGGIQEAADKKLFTTVCPVFVRDAVDILDEML